jgi:hypothetical protein
MVVWSSVFCPGEGRAGYNRRWYGSDRGRDGGHGATRVRKRVWARCGTCGLSGAAGHCYAGPPYEIRHRGRRLRAGARPRTAP